MDRLVAFRIVDEGIHPSWHLHQDVDLRRNVLARPGQRAFLARYGRQDFFEERTIVELETAMREIAEIVERENELNRQVEDK